MKILIPILLGLIGAEAALGVLGLATRHASHASRPPARAQLIDVVIPRPTTPAPVPPATSPTAAATKVFTSKAAAPRAKTIAEPAPNSAAGSRPSPTSTAPAPTGWGCGSAISYLSANSAPGYRFVCPGYAEGHQAMTCNNNSACPGFQEIVITDPCPAAYMNEAHNSWIVSGLRTGVIDPYGNCP